MKASMLYAKYQHMKNQPLWKLLAADNGWAILGMLQIQKSRITEPEVGKIISYAAFDGSPEGIGKIAEKYLSSENVKLNKLAIKQNTLLFYVILNRKIC